MVTFSTNENETPDKEEVFVAHFIDLNAFLFACTEF